MSALSGVLNVLQKRGKMAKHIKEHEKKRKTAEKQSLSPVLDATAAPVADKPVAVPLQDGDNGDIDAELEALETMYGKDSPDNYSTSEAAPKGDTDENDE